LACFHLTFAFTPVFPRFSFNSKLNFEDNARLYHVGLSYCHVKADGTEGKTVSAVYEIP